MIRAVFFPCARLSLGFFWPISGDYFHGTVFFLESLLFGVRYMFDAYLFRYCFALILCTLMRFFPQKKLVFSCRPCPFCVRVCDILRSDFCVFGGWFCLRCPCVYLLYVQRHVNANKGTNSSAPPPATSKEWSASRT